MTCGLRKLRRVHLQQPHRKHLLKVLLATRSHAPRKVATPYLHLGGSIRKEENNERSWFQHRYANRT